MGSSKTACTNRLFRAWAWGFGVAPSPSLGYWLASTFYGLACAIREFDVAWYRLGTGLGTSRKLVSRAANEQTGLRPACGEHGKGNYTGAAIQYLVNNSFLERVLSSSLLSHSAKLANEIELQTRISYFQPFSSSSSWIARFYILNVVHKPFE